MHHTILRHVTCFLSMLLFSKIVNVGSIMSQLNRQLPIVTPVENYTVMKFAPYRYDRFVFFFFSENATGRLFEAVWNELMEFDEYCGGENVQIKLIWGCSPYSEHYDYYFMNFRSIYYQLGSISDYLTVAIIQNVTAGDIDRKDIGDLAKTLQEQARILSTDFSENETVEITKQIILITDYATDSIKNANTTKVLSELKSKGISFIALVTNLSDSIVNESFGNSNIWTAYSNYLIWKSNEANPICGYISNSYTTPKPIFSDDLTLYIYLFLSTNYISNNIEVVVDLLSYLSLRRWWYPCSQYNSISFNLTYESPQLVQGVDRCYVEDANLYIPDPDYDFCSRAWFHSKLALNETGIDSLDHDLACTYVYRDFFDTFTGKSFMGLVEHQKFLLITDLPMSCSFNTNYVTEKLKSFTDYSSGAPLTVIAIDKMNDKSVALSYERIFPPTQRPNLYEVNDIHELFPNINKTINFCLNSAPWIYYGDRQYPEMVWYFYLVGAIILIALVAIFVYSIVKWRERFYCLIVKWRKQRQQELHAAMRLQAAATNLMTLNSSYEYVARPTKSDIWEISLELLDIDYKETIGKGAFSVVYSGFLRGKAPVLEIFPSIALQQFDNCEVAVKTLPHYYNENAKTNFCEEIRLMKDIGFNAHLVSMLGCNCSIDRPILVLELAELSLLNWLISNRSSMIETEINLFKTLLSITWQVSDGMNYLSSKYYVHRDIAARNILLNKEFKAMVSDFGLCRKLDCAEQVLTIADEKLPVKWMAIESLCGQQFSLKTDVWSFGILLFEIFSLGQEPYKQLIGEEILIFLTKGKRPDQPELANEQIHELMKKCWQSDPKIRPDFESIRSNFEGMLEDTVADYGYLQARE